MTLKLVLEYGPDHELRHSSGWGMQRCLYVTFVSPTSPSVFVLNLWKSGFQHKLTSAPKEPLQKLGIWHKYCYGDLGQMGFSQLEECAYRRIGADALFWEKGWFWGQSTRVRLWKTLSKSHNFSVPQFPLCVRGIIALPFSHILPCLCGL